MSGLLYDAPLMGALTPRTGLNQFSGVGLAPYGIRHSGQGAKGLGYFGALPGTDGHSTELSSEFDHNGKSIEHPLLVPTLSREQINQLLGGADPSEDIYAKARAHALMRMQQGLSPFAGPQELRLPLPR
jgi:hypothetical protein